MSEVKFTLPVTVEKVAMLKDRSVKVTVHTTQEIPDPEFYVIHKAFQENGWMVFASNRLSEADVPKEDAPSDQKSQAQRIRGTLWHCWDKNTDHSEDFDAYYRRRTEKVINHFKQELDA